ncbi:hypothetical protein RJT34_25182 [Clitoria ternatea]|uniref:Uncharacterized protein n=1 Tax=Clitoria ternatea TaxID=43366 RepID=A0AAN9IJT5_CLITE
MFTLYAYLGIQLEKNKKKKVICFLAAVDYGIKAIKEIILSECFCIHNMVLCDNGVNTKLEIKQRHHPHSTWGLLFQLALSVISCDNTCISIACLK